MNQRNRQMKAKQDIGPRHLQVRAPGEIDRHLRHHQILSLIQNHRDKNLSRLRQASRRVVANPSQGRKPARCDDPRTYVCADPMS